MAPLVNRELVTAYLIDRADQYETSSGSWVGLVDAARDIMNGEFDAAVDHGELEDADLMKRVRSMVRP